MSIGDSSLAAIGALSGYGGAASIAQAAAATQGGLSAAGTLPQPGALPSAGLTDAQETSALDSELLTAQLGTSPAAGASVASAPAQPSLISSAQLLNVLRTIPSQNASQALALLQVHVPGTPTIGASPTGDLSGPARNPITDTF